MTPEGLRARHLERHPQSHFFDTDTLRFFGESLSEMRVLERRAEIVDVMGEPHTCYILSSLQKKHPLGARWVHHYFDTQTFEHVIQ